MERKYANYPGWQRILQHRFYCAHLDTPAFQGYISLFCMDAVRAPLIVNNFQRPTCIVDAGYAWLKQFPAGAHYTVTTHYDAQARIVAWYIDICLRTGVGDDQIPWLDDLYLDLIISPERAVEIKDADELLAARESGDITAAEYELAWCEANRLIEQIANNQLALLDLSDTHRQLLLAG